jgi:hypothetical protein
MTARIHLSVATRGERQIGLRWARNLLGCKASWAAGWGVSELGREVKGAKKDFGCWAESSRGPKGRNKRIQEKGFLLFLEFIFGKRII